MSQDWTAGYVTDVNYTHGYYDGLNPVRARLALLHAGIDLPQVETACELGFGQGMSVNIHAAASATQWHGTDFNPSQSAFAQAIARAAGAGAQLTDQSFAEFCLRTDLPDFDFVGLHGIWSWISAENRKVIVDFLKRKLKVGGVLYISYNAQPGWAAMAPMRDLMADYAAAMLPPGLGMVQRVEDTLAFVDRVLAASPVFAAANPQTVDRVAKIKGLSRQYLAHEYFNRDWEPMAFAEISRWLSAAKLGWGCSAQFLDAVDGINLQKPQIELLSSLPDVAMRQTVRDIFVNQQFRRDLWVKGAQSLTRMEQLERMATLRVILTRPRGEVALKAIGTLGEAALPEALYGPVLEALADHRPRSLGQLATALRGQGPEGKDISLPQVCEILLVLCGIGAATPAQDDAIIARARERSDRLNAHLLLRARSGGDIGVLASPVTGGAVHVARVPQLFLLARGQGRATPAEWARYAWDVVAVQGQRLVKDGTVLEGADANLAELGALAEGFAQKSLPVLQALQVA